MDEQTDTPLRPLFKANTVQPRVRSERPVMLQFKYFVVPITI